MIELDDIDRNILRSLSQDAGQSAGALAKRFGLSQPAMWRRIKRLADLGIIKGHRLVLDREKLGLGVTVFLGIKLATKGRVSLEDFERAVTAIPEVQSVEHVWACMIIACAWWRVIFPISNGYCAAVS